MLIAPALSSFICPLLHTKAFSEGREIYFVIINRIAWDELFQMNALNIVRLHERNLYRS